MMSLLYINTVSLSLSLSLSLGPSVLKMPGVWRRRIPFVLQAESGQNVVQDFYYNATHQAPPKREYGEATLTQTPGNHQLFP